MILYNMGPLTAEHCEPLTSQRLFFLGQPVTTYRRYSFRSRVNTLHQLRRAAHWEAKTWWLKDTEEKGWKLKAKSEEEGKVWDHLWSLWWEPCVSDFIQAWSLSRRGSEGRKEGRDGGDERGNTVESLIETMSLSVSRHSWLQRELLPHGDVSDRLLHTHTGRESVRVCVWKARAHTHTECAGVSNPCLVFVLQDGILFGMVGAYDWDGGVLKEGLNGRVMPPREAFESEFPLELKNHAAYLGDCNRNLGITNSACWIYTLPWECETDFSVTMRSSLGQLLKICRSERSQFCAGKPGGDLELHAGTNSPEILHTVKSKISQKWQCFYSFY